MSSVLFEDERGLMTNNYSEPHFFNFHLGAVQIPDTWICLLLFSIARPVDEEWFQNSLFPIAPSLQVSLR